MARKRFWGELKSSEFSELDPHATVAVLPVAAIEQHGPHLPVYVDACLNEGVVAHAITLVPPDLPVTFLPMQAVGKSNEHLAFPGTLSLSAETIIRLWTEIGECVNRAIDALIAMVQEETSELRAELEARLQGEPEDGPTEATTPKEIRSNSSGAP